MAFKHSSCVDTVCVVAVSPVASAAAVVDVSGVGIVVDPVVVDAFVELDIDDWIIVDG